MEQRLPEVVDLLAAEGAVFAYLHGSRAVDAAREGSDTDVAAWFGRAVDGIAVAARPGFPQFVGRFGGAPRRLCWSAAFSMAETRKRVGTRLGA